MPQREFATQRELIDYAEQNGLVYVWAFGHRGSLIDLHSLRQAALRPSRSAFPLASALRSTNSAADRSALFVGFQLLWQSPTSRARASSATAPHLPDADRRHKQLTARREISQVPTRSICA
jgi:hypothetical protein